MKREMMEPTEMTYGSIGNYENYTWESIETTCRNGEAREMKYGDMTRGHMRNYMWVNAIWVNEMWENDKLNMEHVNTFDKIIIKEDNIIFFF